MKAQAVAARVQVRRSRHLGAYVDPKTASARRTLELFQEVAQLLREIQALRVTPGMPVFTTGAAATPPPQHPSRYGPALARGSAKSFARSSRS